jgi:N-acetylglutamate synthase-like GNAT family acetyltransferase
MCPDDEDILAHLIKTNQHKDKEIYFIFADENTLIGAIVVKNDTKRRECVIQDIAVIPSHRRQGHAEKALRGLINSRYPVWSFKLRASYSTTEGQALFNKLGFRIHKVEWLMTPTKKDVVLH